MTDKELLQMHLRQLKEVLIAIENKEQSQFSISPEEIRKAIAVKSDEKFLHPQLKNITSNGICKDEVKKMIKRIENDLNDLELNSEELYTLPLNTFEKDEQVESNYIKNTTEIEEKVKQTTDEQTTLFSYTN